MRPSILPNLIDAAARNEARGLADPALFEVGPQYKDATPHGPAHGRRRHAPQHGGAAQLGRARRAPSTPSMPRPTRWPCWPPSARRSTTCRPRPGAPDWYHPGRSGVIKLGDRVMAHFGELHPEIAGRRRPQGPGRRLRGVPRRAAAAQGQGRPRRGRSSCCRPSSRSSATSPSSSMPSVEAEKLVRAARNADKALIAGRARVRRLCRQGRARRQEVDRHRRHPAAGRAHADRCGDRGGRVPRSWRRWPRQPARCLRG